MWCCTQLGVALTLFSALQLQGTDSVSRGLNDILKGTPQAGATRNNGNVVKALVAGLPFWGVKPATLIRYIGH